MSNIAECPVCGNELQFEEALVLSQLVRCGDCTADLEVRGIDPVSLEEAPGEDEDWGE